MRLSPRLILFTLAACFAFTGCQYIPIAKDYRNVKDVQIQLDKLYADHQIALAANTVAVENKMNELLAQKDAQLQGAADSLYGAGEAFKYYLTPVRLDIIIHNRVEEAQAAVGRAPTFAAIQKENARLLTELDETKTSLAQLQKTHTDEVAAKTKLSEDAIRIQKELEGVKQAKLDAEVEFNAKNKLLSDKLRTANSIVQSDLRQKADDQASIERIKMKMITACGIGALLCVLGAIYLPGNLRGGAIVLGVVLGGAAMAIPFIEGWMVAAGILVTVLGVFAYFGIQHKTVVTANTNLISAIQDTKDSATPNSPATLMENVQAWNTKYVKDASGKIVSVPDTKVESYIQKTLIGLGRLSAPVVLPTEPAVVTPAPTPTITTT